MTQKKGVALNNLSIQVNNVIWLPLKMHELHLSRTHLDMFVIQDVKKCWF